MKPVIGIMPIYDKGCGNTWMLDAYVDAVLEQGGIPVMLPITEDEQVIRQMVETLDGFLFTGGDDVSPVVYGALKTYTLDEYLPKDLMEVQYIRTILELDKPLFGICRGLQILNAALGGTLYQDLAMERKGVPTEIHKQIVPCDEKIHRVTIEKNSRLCAIIGSTEYEVNSLHHQAVKRTAEVLRVTAEAPDGIVEAVEYEGKRFVLAVQWHPELLFRKESVSRQLFAAFTEACRQI